MNKHEGALSLVTDKAQVVADNRVRLEEEARLWVEKQLASAEAELRDAVVAAVSEGATVVSVARAYTVSGKTPNRKAVYSILEQGQGDDAEYPFEWVEREVKTAKGKKVVYDVLATLDEYGPDYLSGEYTWRYDEFNRSLEQVIGDADPYPEDKPFYKLALVSWFNGQRYPGHD